MPKFHQVFCQTPAGKPTLDLLRKGTCPLSGSLCDGGGNRHQTKLSDKDLAKIDDGSLTTDATIPAVCSVDYGNDPWIVCPRRLFSFPKLQDGSVNIVNQLSEYENDILLSSGFDRGDILGIWPEVYLKYSNDDADINYHFDYIVCKLHENTVSLSDAYLQLGLETKEDKKKLKDTLRKVALIESRAQDSDCIKFFPDLSDFSILEVMTASTSGSNKEKGTDIKSAYIKMLNGENYECPGINKRQVWGRMATQLFAKSVLAESWGSKTYWVVQDKLLQNIALTTKLTLTTYNGNEKSAVNFLSLGFNERGAVELLKKYNIPSGISDGEKSSCVDILIPKENPSKQELLKSILRAKLSAIVTLK